MLGGGSGCGGCDGVGGGVWGFLWFLVLCCDLVLCILLLVFVVGDGCPMDFGSLGYM